MTHLRSEISALATCQDDIEFGEAGLLAAASPETARLSERRRPLVRLRQTPLGNGFCFVPGGFGRLPSGPLSNMSPALEIPVVVNPNMAHGRDYCLPASRLSIARVRRVALGLGRPVHWVG